MVGGGAYSTEVTSLAPEGAVAVSKAESKLLEEGERGQSWRDTNTDEVTDSQDLGR